MSFIYLVAPHFSSASLDPFGLGQNLDMPMAYFFFNLWSNFQLKLEIESKFRTLNKNNHFKKWDHLKTNNIRASKWELIY